MNMNMNQSMTIVVVLGMHRSGTSAITRGLAVLGVNLGTDLVPAAADNVKGFWEDREFLEINECLLAQAGSAYDRFLEDTAEFTSSSALDALRQRAHELTRGRLSEFGGSWGVKDPRACRLLGFWQDIFAASGARTVYLIVHRHPTSVVDSMQRRNDIPAEKAYILWAQHLLQALRSTQGKPRALIDYDAFLDAPKACLSAIARALGLCVPAQNTASLREFTEHFLDPSLRHSRYGEAAVEHDARAVRPVLELHRLLLDAAGGRVDLDGADFSASLEAIARDFAMLKPAIHYVNQLEDQRLHHWKSIANLEWVVKEYTHQIAQLRARVAELERSCDANAFSSNPS
jgi:hypothetical protein